MLAASECGFIIDPDRIEGKFEDFIGVYRRFVHHDICAAIVQNFETYLEINPDIVQHGKEQMPDKKLARHDVSICLLYTSPSPRDATLPRMPSSA